MSKTINLKIIPGIKNYLACDDGRIWSIRKKIFLKPFQSKNGYLMVKIKVDKDKKQTNYLVHRLIALAFLPIINGKDVVDHINTDRTDNRVENLRWCDVKENLNNPLTKNKMTEHLKKLSDKSSKKVKQYDLSGIFLNEYVSVRDASRKTGVDNRCISRCCEGKYKHAGNYLWRY